MKKTLKFEDAMKRLQKIVEKMESAEPDLDESLKLFEEGVALVRECSSKLEETRKKVEVLVKKSGSFSAKKFDPSEEED